MNLQMKDQKQLNHEQKQLHDTNVILKENDIQTQQISRKAQSNRQVNSNDNQSEEKKQEYGIREQNKDILQVNNQQKQYFIEKIEKIHPDLIFRKKADLLTNLKLKTYDHQDEDGQQNNAQQSNENLKNLITLQQSPDFQQATMMKKEKEQLQNILFSSYHMNEKSVRNKTNQSQLEQVTANKQQLVENNEESVHNNNNQKLDTINPIQNIQNIIQKQKQLEAQKIINNQNQKDRQSKEQKVNQDELKCKNHENHNKTLEKIQIVKKEEYKQQTFDKLINLNLIKVLETNDNSKKKLNPLNAGSNMLQLFNQTERKKQQNNSIKSNQLIFNNKDAQQLKEVSKQLDLKIKRNQIQIHQEKQQANNKEDDNITEDLKKNQTTKIIIVPKNQDNEKTELEPKSEIQLEDDHKEKHKKIVQQQSNLKSVKSENELKQNEEQFQPKLNEEQVVQKEEDQNKKLKTQQDKLNALNQHIQQQQGPFKIQIPENHQQALIIELQKKQHQQINCQQLFEKQNKNKNDFEEGIQSNIVIRLDSHIKQVLQQRAEQQDQHIFQQQNKQIIDIAHQQHQINVNNTNNTNNAKKYPKQQSQNNYQTKAQSTKILELEANNNNNNTLLNHQQFININETTKPSAIVIDFDESDNDNENKNENENENGEKCNNKKQLQLLNNQNNQQQQQGLNRQQTKQYSKQNKIDQSNQDDQQQQYANNQCQENKQQKVQNKLKQRNQDIEQSKVQENQQQNNRNTSENEIDKYHHNSQQSHKIAVNSKLQQQQDIEAIKNVQIRQKIDDNNSKEIQNQCQNKLINSKCKEELNQNDQNRITIVKKNSKRKLQPENSESQKKIVRNAEVHNAIVGIHKIQKNPNQIPLYRPLHMKKKQLKNASNQLQNYQPIQSMLSQLDQQNQPYPQPQLVPHQKIEISSNVINLTIGQILEVKHRKNDQMKQMLMRQIQQLKEQIKIFQKQDQLQEEIIKAKQNQNQKNKYSNNLKIQIPEKSKETSEAVVYTNFLQTAVDVNQYQQHQYQRQYQQNNQQKNFSYNQFAQKQQTQMIQERNLDQQSGLKKKRRSFYTPRIPKPQFMNFTSENDSKFQDGNNVKNFGQVYSSPFIELDSAKKNNSSTKNRIFGRIYRRDSKQKSRLDASNITSELKDSRFSKLLRQNEGSFLQNNFQSQDNIQTPKISTIQDNIKHLTLVKQSQSKQVQKSQQRIVSPAKSTKNIGIIVNIKQSPQIINKIQTKDNEVDTPQINQLQTLIIPDKYIKSVEIIASSQFKQKAWNQRLQIVKQQLQAIQLTTSQQIQLILPNSSSTQQQLVHFAHKIFLKFGINIQNAQFLLNIKKYKNCILFCLNNEDNIIYHYDNKYYFGGWINSYKTGYGFELNQKYIYKGQYRNNRKEGLGAIRMTKSLENNLNTLSEKQRSQQKEKKRQKITPNINKTNQQTSSTLSTSYIYYYGYWHSNCRHGYGIQIQFTLNHVIQYCGNWIENKKSGNGILTIYSKRNNEFIQKYQGQFLDGMKHAKGYQIFANGDNYQGYYQNNKFHGKGSYKWKNGAVYKGDFEFGYRQGNGEWFSQQITLFNQNIYNNNQRQNHQKTLFQCDTYKGQYKNDKKNGFGVYRWKNGTVYEGEFVNDLKHGQGVIIYEGGKQIKHTWEHGEIIINKKKIQAELYNQTQNSKQQADDQGIKNYRRLSHKKQNFKLPNQMNQNKQSNKLIKLPGMYDKNSSEKDKNSNSIKKLSTTMPLQFGRMPSKSKKQESFNKNALNLLKRNQNRNQLSFDEFKQGQNNQAETRKSRNLSSNQLSKNQISIKNKRPYKQEMSSMNSQKKYNANNIHNQIGAGIKFNDKASKQKKPQTSKEKSGYVHSRNPLIKHSQELASQGKRKLVNPQKFIRKQ